MNINDQLESPMLLKISFNKLIEKYEELVKSKDPFIANKAKRVLEAQALHPELRDGITDVSLLEKYEDEIRSTLR